MPLLVPEIGESPVRHGEEGAEEEGEGLGLQYSWMDWRGRWFSSKALSAQISRYAMLWPKCVKISR